MKSFNSYLLALIAAICVLSTPSLERAAGAAAAEAVAEVEGPDLRAFLQAKDPGQVAAQFPWLTELLKGIYGQRRKDAFKMMQMVLEKEKPADKDIQEVLGRAVRIIKPVFESGYYKAKGSLEKIINRVTENLRSRINVKALKSDLRAIQTESKSQFDIERTWGLLNNVFFDLLVATIRAIERLTRERIQADDLIGRIQKVQNLYQALERSPVLRDSVYKLFSGENGLVVECLACYFGESIPKRPGEILTLRDLPGIVKGSVHELNAFCIFSTPEYQETFGALKEANEHLPVPETGEYPPFVRRRVAEQVREVEEQVREIDLETEFAIIECKLMESLPRDLPAVSDVSLRHRRAIKELYLDSQEEAERHMGMFRGDPQKRIQEINERLKSIGEQLRKVDFPEFGKEPAEEPVGLRDQKTELEQELKVYQSIQETGFNTFAAETRKNAWMEAKQRALRARRSAYRQAIEYFKETPFSPIDDRIGRDVRQFIDQLHIAAEREIAAERGKPLVVFVSERSVLPDNLDKLLYLGEHIGAYMERHPELLLIFIKEGEELSDAVKQAIRDFRDPIKRRGGLFWFNKAVVSVRDVAKPSDFEYLREERGAGAAAMPRRERPPVERRPRPPRRLERPPAERWRPRPPREVGKQEQGKNA